MPAGGDLGRDPGVVQGEQGVVVDDDVAAPGPFLPLGDSSSARWFSAKNRCRVFQSRSTRACRMNSSRDVSGSIRSNCTVRAATSVTPSSITFSVASTLARLAFHRGSE